MVAQTSRWSQANLSVFGGWRTPSQNQQYGMVNLETPGEILTSPLLLDQFMPILGLVQFGGSLTKRSIFREHDPVNTLLVLQMESGDVLLTEDGEPLLED